MKRYLQETRVWLCPGAGERPVLAAGFELTADLDAFYSRNDEISVTTYSDLPLLGAGADAWLVVHVSQKPQAAAVPVRVYQNTVVYDLGREPAKTTTEFLRIGSDVAVPLEELPPKVHA